MLLILSLIAIGLAIWCLCAEMKIYDYKFRGFQGNLTAPAELPAALAVLDRRHVADDDAQTVARGLRPLPITA